MKVFIVLAVLIGVASAGYSSSPLSGASVEQGTSSQYREDDDAGNYKFGYDESHTSGGSSRREEQVNGVRRGSYSLTDADGRRRTVNYIADASGFHATIQTNEPGVEAKDPANVMINTACGSAGCNGPVAATNYAAQDTSAPWNAGYSAAAAAAAAAPQLLRAAPLQQTYADVATAAPAPRASYSAPAPILRQQSYAPVMVVRQQSYGAAPRLAAPVQSYATTNNYEQQTYEAPAPRAFRYAFGASHQASYGNMNSYAAPQYQQQQQQASYAVPAMRSAY